MQRTAQLGLVLVLGLVILAWGTSPCLFASMLSADGGCGTAVQECSCGDCSCCETDPAPADEPASGSDECPVCSSIGNMHELVPLGARVDLDAPAVSICVPLAAPLAPASPERPVAATDLGMLEPPRVHFCTTVALLR
ncbi:MAG: hypothetical protein QNJ98_12850 [Planctomycetota bacterium]|nr:hypothetical protein [Planctomycetota bacterium]